MTDLQNLSLCLGNGDPVTDTAFCRIFYHQLFQHLRLPLRDTFQFWRIDIQKNGLRLLLIQFHIQFQHHIHQKHPFFPVCIRFDLQIGLQHRRVDIRDHIHRTSRAGKFPGKWYRLFQPLQRICLIIGHIQHKYRQFAPRGHLSLLCPHLQSPYLNILPQNLMNIRFIRGKCDLFFFPQDIFFMYTKRQHPDRLFLCGNLVSPL